MADIIQLLPDHVANQIAAGEVVQRPASVVKELLENAIDAGAGAVKLIVKDGGKTLIQVVDDGSGMSGTDARLSFERHATSKIRSADDLFSIHTKGFRGEALAAIAAISHVEMHTRPAGEELGTLLRIEGSEVTAQEVTATAKGTSIAVKNLFFNIPARRNFLKSKQVELRHITDEFHRVALAHPNVAFQCYHNGSELFHLAVTKHRQRIVHVFGSKTNEKLVPVEEQTQIVRISGFICKPEYAKKSRGEQFFFINNRFVKSPYLHHAVISAFEGLIRPDAFPGYFLYLEVAPSSIDINIHPTKTEIKFDDEHALYAILRAAVKHSLGQFHVGPALDFERDRNLDTPYSYRTRGAVEPNIAVDRKFNPFLPDHGRHGHRPAASQAGSWETLYVGLESKLGGEEAFSSVHYESDSITGSIFEGVNSGENSAIVTFQLKRKYIVTTIKSGLLVIDQNRAHQRVLYEKFLRGSTRNNTVSQQLLFPVQLSFSPAETGMLAEIRESLEAMGFVFEPSDKEGIMITGVPPLVPESEVQGILDQFLADYQQDAAKQSLSQSDLLSRTLCKTLSVKAGDLLEAGSQMALVDDLFACKETRVSPFNRPIYVTITENEIDNKFI